MAPDCPREVAERSPTRSDGPMPLAHLAAHFEGCLPHSQRSSPSLTTTKEHARSETARSPDDCASLVYPRAPLMPFHIFSSMLHNRSFASPLASLRSARAAHAGPEAKFGLGYDGPCSHRPYLAA